MPRGPARPAPSVFPALRSPVRHPTDHIFEFTPESLAAWCGQRGMPAFRARQILEWVYARGVADPSQMSNLSKRDRDLLAAEMTFRSGDVISHQRASDGTQKLLVQWRDGGGEGGANGAKAAKGADAGKEVDDGYERTISLPLSGPSGDSVRTLDTARQTECVMIPAGGSIKEWNDGDDEVQAVQTRVRRTACISSQVGCPVGCRFCASGIGGLDGNLSAGRIVEQVWGLQSVLGSQPLGIPPGTGGLPRITNVVFMGMGEPLSNFSAVTSAIRVLNAPWGMNIGARRITISTVGLPKAIEKLAAEFELPVTLALSLHAPTDEIRRSLIPWAEYTTIADLLAACQKWFSKTGREITLEYILLREVNDRPEHARQLAEVARTLRANVNLIRYNEVKGMPFGRPEDDDVLAFQRILRDARVNTHIRASRGRDIAAACGQLRHEATQQAARP